MTQGKIWLNGSLIDWDNAKIHVLTHGLHYATGVFEGVRCYKTVDGSAIFRLSDHIQRLMDSARIYFMDLGYTKQQLERAIIETVKANDLEECYIRPIAYYGYGKMGVNPLPNKVSIAIATWKWDEYLKRSDGTDKGVRVMVSSWIRIDNRAMPMRAKATANYANSVLARVEALKAGFDEAIMLNSVGAVVEASAENIFIAKDNVLVTPPISSGALEGITRNSILAIAKEKGIEYEVRDISRDELYIATEVFLTGTAAEIKPVVEIDNRTIGDGQTGKMTKELALLFDEIVHGRDKKFSKMWLTPIN
ncbi:MAG TPA: branched-chain amino acid transaminase [Nitrososphaera sp.]|jgi:branched-chain amino acid aminotransferase|nr:branched-chain amino acid transaminase [Nitrososphaera sp.]